MSKPTNLDAPGAGGSGLIEGFSRWSVRWIPDAMVFVLVLTLIIFVLAWFLTPHSPYQLMHDWVNGFWTLLTFAMQMSVLMVTGFCVADSRPVHRLITKFATSFKRPSSAIMAYSLLIAVIWWLHWGVGMMVGIIMGRELCARNKGMGLHYPMVAAIASSAIICAAGPSVAAPLFLATPGHFMADATGVIPISQTVFDSHMLVINAALILLFPVMYRLMTPKKERTVEITDERIAEFTAETPVKDHAALTPAEKLDHSLLLVCLVGIIGLIWIGEFLWNKGIGSLDLNTLNFIFLIGGIILHGNANSYVASAQRGVITVGGVIIQFPFYAGIFGIIKFSGLSGIIAGWFVAVSSAETFPLITFIYSGILNIFVPSGGSKFVIEAPYLIPAAQQTGAHLPYVINAYSLGDVTTNMIQPFWALPILGAFKLKFQEILPYQVMLMLVFSIIIVLGLYFLPMLW
jgi:short-chain fatty acids transporter